MTTTNQTEKLPYIERFLQYLGENPDVAATKQFVCSAYIGKKPFNVTLTPIGIVSLYPEYIIFLTDSKAKPGGFRQFVSQFWDEFSPYLTAHRLVTQPYTIVFDLARSMGRNGDEEFFNQALTSPNSFIVPLDKIKKVDTSRNFQGNFIHITTFDRELTLFNNINAQVPEGLRYLIGKKPLKKFESAPAAIGKFYQALLTGNWHEDVVEVLKRASAHNSG